MKQKLTVASVHTSLRLGSIFVLMALTACKRQDNGAEDSPRFLAKVSYAKTHPEGDQISRFFHVVNQIRLRDPRVVPTRIAGDINHLVLVDTPGHRVYHLLPDGRVQIIGTFGSKPGEYTFPVDASVKGNRIFVADAQVRRVNVYDLSGKFATSFIYGLQHFMASRIINDPSTDQSILLGAQRSSTQAGNFVSFAHRYGPDGQFVSSSFDDVSDSSYSLYEGPIPFVDQAGHTYAVLPYDQKVVSLSQALGAPKLEPAPQFRAPMSPFKPQAGKAFQSSVQEWELQWTPIVFAGISGSNLYLQYQTFAPLRYTTAVWDFATGIFKASFQTNTLLKHIDSEGKLWAVVPCLLIKDQCSETTLVTYELN